MNDFSPSNLLFVDKRILHTSGNPNQPFQDLDTLGLMKTLDHGARNSRYNVGNVAAFEIGWEQKPLGSVYLFAELNLAKLSLISLLLTV